MRNIHPPIPPYCFAGVSRPKFPSAGIGRDDDAGDPGGAPPPGDPGGAPPGDPPKLVVISHCCLMGEFCARACTDVCSQIFMMTDELPNTLSDSYGKIPEFASISAL